MILRTKDGSCPENRHPCLFSGSEFLRCKNSSGIISTASMPSSVLLDYLGIKKEAEGIQTVKGDIELIACVPFSMNKEQGAINNEGVAWTFSTFDLDRYHERIDPAGWDFSQFIKNPVIEWAHRYDIPAIGKAENIFVDETGLHGVIVFNDREYDPFGWSIGQRVKAGVISGVCWLSGYGN